MHITRLVLRFGMIKGRQIFDFSENKNMLFLP